MAFTKKTVRDVDVDGKRVLVRVDFNVPLKDGVVTDDTRVRAAIPTITYLKEHNAAIILMSHLGRPKGDGPEPELSLKPAADKLAELTGYDVKFVDDTYGEKAEAAVKALRPGEILVLQGRDERRRDSRVRHFKVGERRAQGRPFEHRLRWNHQGCSSSQRHDEVVDRRIETGRGELQYP